MDNVGICKLKFLTLPWFLLDCSDVNKDVYIWLVFVSIDIGFDDYIF